MGTEQPRLLVVDDNDGLRALYALALEEVGHVLAFSSVPRAIPHLLSVDVVVTDLMMPGMTGLDLLDHIRDLGIDVPVLVVTAQEDSSPMVLEVRKRGIPVLFKPFRVRQLLTSLERLQARAARKRLARKETPAALLRPLASSA